MVSCTYFDCLDELLGVGFELPFAFFKLVGTGSYDTPGSNCSFRDIPIELVRNNQSRCNEHVPAGQGK